MGAKLIGTFKIILVFISLCFFAPNASAERLYGHYDPPRFKPQRIGLKYEMDYFSANGNYPTGGGSEVSLPGTNSFSAYNFHLQVDYDWSSKMSGTLALQIGASESEDIEFDRSNSAIKGILLGGAYRLNFLKGWATVADAFYFMALEENSRNDDKVSIGDGVGWLGGGMWFGKRLNQDWLMWSYLGLRFRSGGLSSLLLYSVKPYWRRNLYRIGFGLEGFISVIDDDLTSDPTARLEVSSNFNGNSLRYYSVNPSYHEVQLWAGYKFKPYTEMRFGFGMPIAGESTATGFRVFATMETSVGWQSGRLIFPFKSLRSTRSKVKSSSKKKSKKRKRSIFKPKPKKKKKTSPFRVPVK